MGDYEKIPMETDDEDMIGCRCCEDVCEEFFKVRLSDVNPQSRKIMCPCCGAREYFKSMFARGKLKHTLLVKTNEFMEGFGKSFGNMGTKPNPNAVISMRTKVESDNPEMKNPADRKLKHTISCKQCSKPFSSDCVPSFCPYCEIKLP